MDAGDVDDPAPAAVVHARAAPAGEPERRLEHQPVDPLELFGLEVLDRRDVLDAGAVDEHVGVEIELVDGVASVRSSTRWSAPMSAATLAARLAVAVEDRDLGAASASRVATAAPMPLAPPVTTRAGPKRRRGQSLGHTPHARAPLLGPTCAGSPQIQPETCVVAELCRPAEPVHPQRELEVKRPGRVAPARAEQLADPVEPLRDRVGVDVQPRGGVLDPAAGGEPRVEGLDAGWCRARRRSRGPGRASPSTYAASCSGPFSPSSSRARPEPGGVADLAGAAEGDQGVEAAPRLGVRRGEVVGPAAATPTVAVAPGRAERGGAARAPTASGSSPGTSSTRPPWCSPASPRCADGEPAEHPDRRRSRSSPSTAATATTSGPSRTTLLAPGPLAQAEVAAGRASSRSPSSSPPSRSSVSATVRAKSSTSAVTSAPRSRVRRSACGSSARAVQHERGDVLGAGQRGGDVRAAGARRCARRRPRRRPPPPARRRRPRPRAARPSGSWTARSPPSTSASTRGHLRRPRRRAAAGR